MKRMFFVLSLICVASSFGMSQGAPTNRQPQAPPSSAAPAPKPPVQPAQGGATPPEDFVVGPEEVLEITVWREPDLTTKAVVRPDGKIGMTLLNDIQASGLTTTQLKTRIATGLAQFVAEPEVSVVVVEVHSQMVHLIGAVARPGAYPLGGPLTVMELLARAGGLGESAKSQEIAVVRTDGKATQRIAFNYKAFIEGKDLGHNLQLKNGDIVVVP